MTEDETVRWHHQLDGHKFEQGLGVGAGQGSLACCSPWGYKESDTTEQLNNMRVVLHDCSPLHRTPGLGESLLYQSSVSGYVGSS